MKHCISCLIYYIKHDLLSFSFAMDDMDEIFLRVLDST